MLYLLILLLFVVLIIAFYVLTMSEKIELLGKINWHGDPKSKMVALTFDDGPNEPFTSQLLDVLDKHKVKASFFVVGSNLEKSPAVTLRAFKCGHTIGNHSYSHLFLNYFTHPTFRAEIESNMDAIKTVIGVMPALYRSPWLFRQPILLTTLKKLGLTPVFGIFGSEKEIFQPAAEELANRAFKRTRAGSILIFHDGYNAKGADRSATIKSIDLLIPKLQNAGYELVTVDRLLQIQAYLGAK